MAVHTTGASLFRDALDTHMEDETINFRYGRQHAGYVEDLNCLIPGNELEDTAHGTVREPAMGVIR